jgi:aspartyl-tRNA(Asn)/glutamyl-tRNA(Gln) amidotransferase subunit C
MKIDRKIIDHVKKLACLSLTDEEAAQMTADLAAIVKYVEELSELDTSNVEPTTSADLVHSAWRADTVEDGLSHDEALLGAPRSADGGFAVPGFVEGAS